jgi:hypothetical protein
MRWLLLLGLLLPSPVPAQPADCPAEPVGPGMRLVPRIALDGRPGVPQGVRGKVPIDLGDVPMFGTACAPAAPPPEDVLRGPPAPRGLLQGDGPRDVLHNRWQGEVTVTPVE